jgi:hypothetical protein
VADFFDLSNTQQNNNDDFFKLDKKETNQPQPEQFSKLMPGNYNTEDEIVENTLKGLASGTMRNVIGGIGAAPSTAARSLYKLAAYPQNKLAEFTGNEDLKVDYDEDFLGKFKALKPIDDVFIRGGEAAANIADNLSPLQNFDKDMLTNFKEGNYRDFGSQLFYNAVETAPQIAMMAYTSGLSGTMSGAAETSNLIGNSITKANLVREMPSIMMGTSAAGSSYIENRQNSDMTEGERLLNAASYGIAEAAWERVWTLPMIRKIAADELIEKPVKEGFLGAAQDYGLKILKGASGEAVEEGGTELTNILTDLSTNKDVGNPFNRVFTATVSALLPGGVMGGAGNINQRNYNLQVQKGAKMAWDTIFNNPQEVEVKKFNLDDNYRPVTKPAQLTTTEIAGLLETKGESPIILESGEALGPPVIELWPESQTYLDTGTGEVFVSGGEEITLPKVNRFVDPSGQYVGNSEIDITTVARQRKQQEDVAQTPIEQPNNVDMPIENENQTDEGLNTQETVEQPVEQQIVVENETAQNFINQAQQQPVGDIDEGIEPFIIQTASSAYRVLTPEGNVKNFNDFFDALEQAADTRNYYEENRVNIQQPIQEGQQQQEGVVEDGGQQEDNQMTEVESPKIGENMQLEDMVEEAQVFARKYKFFENHTYMAWITQNRKLFKQQNNMTENRSFTPEERQQFIEFLENKEINPQFVEDLNEVKQQKEQRKQQLEQQKKQPKERKIIHNAEEMQENNVKVIPERKRLCQKYAYENVQENSGGILHFGTTLGIKMNGERGRVSHSWVEYENSIYDPTYDAYFAKDFYNGELNPESERSYTAAEAKEKLIVGNDKYKLTPEEKKQVKEAGRKAYNMAMQIEPHKGGNGTFITKKMIKVLAADERKKAEIDMKNRIIEEKRKKELEMAQHRQTQKDKLKRKTENENRKTGSAALTEWGQEKADREIITTVYDLVKGDLDRITIDIEEGNISKDKVNQILDKAREVEMLNEPTYNFYKERFNNVETTENQQFKQDLYDKQTMEFEEIFNKAREAGLEISKDEFDLPNSQASVDDIGREYNKTIDEIEKRLEEYQSEQVEEFAQEKAQERMEEIEDKSRPTRQDTLEYRLWQHINGDINSDELFDNLKIVKRSKTRDILGSYTDRKDMIKDLIEKSKNFNQTIKINTPGGYIEIENKPPIYSEREKGKIDTPRGPLVISDIIMALGGTDQSGVFKGETVKTGKPDIDTSQLAEPNNYYIFDNEGEFVQVLKAKPISIPGTEDMDLFRYRIKDQVGKIKNKKTTTPPNYWIITEGKSGAKMSVGRTIKEAAKNLKESFDKTPVETIKSKVNDLIKEGNISPRWGKIIRYEVGNESSPSSYNSRSSAAEQKRTSNSDIYTDRSQSETGNVYKDTINQQTNPGALAQPEIVEIAQAINNGKYPKIVKKIGEGIRGQFSPAKEVIKIRADLFLGERLEQVVVKAKNLKSTMEELEKKYKESPDVVIREERNKSNNRHTVTVYRKDPNFAARTIAHEIGHLIDFLPDKIMTRGNILGRLATLKGHLKHSLQTQNGTVKRDEIMNELKSLSQQWKPFDPRQDKGFTQYRYSSAELYADAISVLFNDPEMVKEVAPTFHSVFMEYLDRKPAVKAVYDEITERVKYEELMHQNREMNIKEMFEEGNELRAKNKEDEGIVISGLDWFIQGMFEKDWGILKQALKAEKGENAELGREARLSLEESRYIDGQIDNYVYTINKSIIQPLKVANLTKEDLGMYMFYKRVIEERNEMANPLGQNEESAKAGLERMRDQLEQEVRETYEEFGVEVDTKQVTDDLIEKLSKMKQFDVLETVAEAYSEIRKYYLMPKLEKSGLYTKELMELMKNNKYYAKFNVQKFMDKKGGTLDSARVYHQIGTLSKIENPFIATVMQDISMIRAAKINQTKEAAIQLLNEQAAESIRPADTFYTPSGGIIPKKSGVRNESIITVVRDGQKQYYYVPSNIASSFEANPIEAVTVVETWSKVMQPLRDLIVSKNPLWMFRNIIRDFKETVKKLPEVRDRDIPKLMELYRQALVESWGEVMLGERSKTIEDMFEQFALTSNRMYGTEELTTEDEIEQLVEQFGLDPISEAERKEFKKKFERFKELISKKTKSPWQLPLLPWDLYEEFIENSKIYEKADRLGRISELAGQIAGYKYLKNNTDYDERKIAHKVRTQVGTPDYKRQGKWNTITNNIWLYSNIAKESVRSSYEAFTNDPGSYIWKTVTMNMIPKLLLMAAPAVVGMLMGEEAEELMQETVDGVTEYDKRNYTIIPLGLTKEGKSIYLRIPEDYEGQIFGKIAYDLAHGNIEGKEGAISDVFDFNPYGSTFGPTNPYYEASTNFLRYKIQGNIPYDEYRGRLIFPDWLPEDEADKAFWRHQWQTMGGSILYDPYHGIKDFDTPLEEALNVFPGNILGTFLRITDYGHQEKEETNPSKTRSGYNSNSKSTGYSTNRNNSGYGNSNNSGGY